MSKEVAVKPAGALAIKPEQIMFDDFQLAALKQLGLDKATPGDLAVYLHYCQRTNMDPFARQIYMIERKGKQSIQMGIDGFRIIAQRSNEYRGQTPVAWCGEDGVWKDVWLEKSPPKAARVGVKRQGFDEPLYAVALWDSYAPYYFDTTSKQLELGVMWKTHGPGQIAKCAEALALRKAFPNDLSGIYTDDELVSEDSDSHKSLDEKPKVEKKEPEIIVFTEEDIANASVSFDAIEQFDDLVKLKGWYDSIPALHDIPVDTSGMTIKRGVTEKIAVLKGKKVV